MSGNELPDALEYRYFASWLVQLQEAKESITILACMVPSTVWDTMDLMEPLDMVLSLKLIVEPNRQRRMDLYLGDAPEGLGDV